MYMYYYNFKFDNGKDSTNLIGCHKSMHVHEIEELIECIIYNIDGDAFKRIGSIGVDIYKPDIVFLSVIEYKE